MYLQVEYVLALLEGRCLDTVCLETLSTRRPEWNQAAKVSIKRPGQSTRLSFTPMQYTAIFHGYKNDNFLMKMFDIFLIFAQNIDCGYTLEPTH